MTLTTDPIALDAWYAVATASEVTHRPARTRLLGQDIVLDRCPETGAVRVRPVLPGGQYGDPLPVIERYACVFTTFGSPDTPIVEIAEAGEPDRRVVPCGWFTIRASGPRIVENFLDMAHFPYVHTDILGSEPHTDVGPYHAEIRADVDEVWATGCHFWQPRGAATERGGGGMMMHIDYRVPSPFIVMLYRTAPSAPDRRDAIALFIQPMGEELCRAQPVEFLVDEISTHTELLHFEQVIFLQDRLILENQVPLRLPLDGQAEIPTRADTASVAYRRWLAAKGLGYGTILPHGQGKRA
ncbi:aromatic ring-hydroxylating dioxygenase subunit alpha [Komagataeibacter kakiaceti JCM 25156]